MLLFDGDPEAWDQLSADAAFARYVRWLDSGYRANWYNNAAEFKRVGSALSLGLVASFLSDAELPTNVKVSLFPIVVHARLLDCALPVFNLYADSPPGSRERLRALQTLRTIATPEQRGAIKTTLLAGLYTSNEFIAAALLAAGEKLLTAADFTQSFMAASSENDYGQGPMARAITQDLLPAATLQTSSAVLEAVIDCLPTPSGAHEFNKFHGQKPPRAWLLDVMPACFERLLSLHGTDTSTYPEICIEAAIHIELLRDVWYTSQELRSTHDQIVNHPQLRWQLAMAFSRASYISHLTTRMCWSGCLVTFGAVDLPYLTFQANDEHLPPAERQFWFEVGKEVAMGHLRKHARRRALAGLTVGVDGHQRAIRIAAERAQTAAAIVRQRQWGREQREFEDERLAQHQSTSEEFRRNIEHVRDASHLGTLCWLVQYSFEHSGRDDIFRVDYITIARDLGSDLAEALAAGLKKLWLSTEPPAPSKYANGAVPWEAILAVAGLYGAMADGKDRSTFTENDTARAARLAVWELKRPPDWFYGLATRNAAVVENALHPWIVAEAHQKGGPGHTRRTLDLALHCGGSIRAGLLRPLVQAVLDLKIPEPGTFNELFDALREDGLLSSDAIERLCRAQLAKSRGSDGLLGDTHWLRVWLLENPHRAWAWFEKNLSSIASTAKAQLRQFVENLSDFKWLRTPVDESSVDILMKLHALVSKHRSEEDAASDRAANTDMFAPSMTRFLETIPGILVGVPGYAAHRALVKLASTESDSVTRVWLNGRVHEHASSQATNSATFDVRSLQLIASPLSREPQSEGQLFEQVIARLEELRTGMEEGPFSDRGLFDKGTKEKLLQLWLAARLRDTPNSKFTIHREEDVDADNETDIQVSARCWNICIEIKPVDAKRGYSAISLTATIREQLVGQYLKGFNSNHGILVLFRLDKKRWDIPGVGKRQTFPALVQYLQDQADAIKASLPHLQRLVVFPVDCVKP